VTGAVPSVAGKISRSGLETRRARPAASISVAGFGTAPDATGWGDEGSVKAGASLSPWA
jgi:hypothetical protein